MGCVECDEYMKDMFLGATVFNQYFGRWAVSSVTDMCCMFCDATSFNQDLSGWNVSSVTVMRLMFTDV